MALLPLRKALAGMRFFPAICTSLSSNHSSAVATSKRWPLTLMVPGASWVASPVLAAPYTLSTAPLGASVVHEPG